MAEPGTAASEPRARTPRRWRWGAVIGLGVLVLMVVACVGSLPWTLARGADGVPRYNAGETRAGRLPPLWLTFTPDQARRAGDLTDPAMARTVLGTDVLGRSLAVRMLLGGAISLGVGLAAAGVAVVVGTLVGVISGYAGGRIDAVLMRCVDVLFGLPYVLVVVLLAVAGDAIVAAASPGEGLRTLLDLAVLLAAIGGTNWLSMARVIRGEILSLKSRAFIDAARTIGVGPARLLLRHLLPNLAGPILVYAMLAVPQAMLQEAFLSFLGIGVKPPLPSWGRLAAEGLSEINPYQSNWWLLVFPCAALAGTLLALNLAGEALRERLDPKAARA